jgi:hypothetical protein
MLIFPFQIDTGRYHAEFTFESVGVTIGRKKGTTTVTRCQISSVDEGPPLKVTAKATCDSRDPFDHVAGMRIAFGKALRGADFDRRTRFDAWNQFHRTLEPVPFDNILIDGAERERRRVERAKSLDAAKQRRQVLSHLRRRQRSMRDEPERASGGMFPPVRVQEVGEPQAETAAGQ